MTDKIDTSPDAVERFYLDYHHTQTYADMKPQDDGDWVRYADYATLSARVAELEAAIKRQAGAAKSLRQHTLAEVQHIKDSERKEYVATKTLSSERDANSILTDEVDALLAKLDRLAKTTAQEAVVWDENCRILQTRAEATKAKLAKAMLALVDGVELAHGVSFSESKIMSAWGQRVERKINSTLAAITDKDAT